MLGGGLQAMAQQKAMQDQQNYDLTWTGNSTSNVLYLNANQGAQSYTTADLGIK